MKKFIFGFLLIYVLFINTGCKNTDNLPNDNYVLTPNNVAFNTDELTAIEVKDNYIILSDGIGINEAKELIINYLFDNDYKSDIENNLKINEITTKQAWDVNKMQLYSIELDYAWLSGVAVISNSEVIGVLQGMPIESIYLADINNDQKYEICVNAYFGSGIIDLGIYVLDTQNSNKYSMSDRMKYDYYLGIDDKTNEITVYRASYNDSSNEGKEFLGKLILENDQLKTIY